VLLSTELVLDLLEGGTRGLGYSREGRGRTGEGVVNSAGTEGGGTRSVTWRGRGSEEGRGIALDIGILGDGRGGERGAAYLERAAHFFEGVFVVSLAGGGDTRQR